MKISTYKYVNGRMQEEYFDTGSTNKEPES